MSKQRSKKGGAVKWILISVAFILVAAFITGLCLQVFAKSEELKPSNWFKKDEETEELPEGEETEDINDSAFVEETQEHGIRLMSARTPKRVASDTYQSSFRLEATVLPADADNKDVKWTLAWANAESRWATGKDVYDYMQGVDTSTDDEVLWGHACKIYSLDVTPLKAYGEQIVVTVTADDTTEEGEEVYASKTFGYVKRIVSITPYVLYTPTSGKAARTDTIVFGDGGTYNFTKYDVTWTDGTLTPTVTPSQWRVNLDTEGVSTALQSLIKEYVNISQFISNTTNWKTFFTNTRVTVAQFKQYAGAKEGQECFKIQVVYGLSCNSADNIYEKAVIAQTSLKIDVSPLTISVASVELNDSENFYF